MSRTRHLTTWTARALLVAGVALPAGLVLALDHPHPDGDDQKKESRVIVRTDKGDNALVDKIHVDKKHRAHGSWTDGDVEVTTTVEDGHVKVIVNGDVVYDGDLSGLGDIDLGEIKLRKLDGALALLKDGDQVMRLGGDGPFVIGDNEIALEHLEGLRLKGLESLGKLRELNLEGGTFEFDFDDEKMKGMLEMAREAGANAFFTSEGDHPQVMLGIQIEQSDEIRAKLHELELNADEVTVVMRPIEGLPAAKSGVKSGDIIIELEGHKSAGQNVLNEVLKGKRAGETIELKVLREGKPKAIVVELEPFDAQALGMRIETPEFGFSPDNLRFAPKWRGLGYSSEELYEISERIAKLAAEMAEATKDERQAMSRKMEVLTKKLTELATSGAGNFSFSGEGDNVWTVKPHGDGGQTYSWSFGDGKSNTWRYALPRIEIEKLENGLGGYVIVTPDDEADDDDDEASSDSDNQKRIRELEAKIRRLERLLEEREHERHRERSDGDV